VTVLPTAEAFAPIQAMQQRMLAATIFLTLLIGGITWWATSWMLRRQLSPMLSAARTLVAQSDSNLAPQPLPVARPDELGELIGGFNRLLNVLSQREEALRESEALFRAVSESAHDAIVTADSSGMIVKWNRGAETVFGYPANGCRAAADC
jgi:PAS domain-containing protein